MPRLVVQHLDKTYPTFHLNDISFELSPGHIVGLIGRNGAGKTTIIKSILHLINAKGDIYIDNQKFIEHEKELKEDIGYINGEFHYYQLKTIKSIVKAYKCFYKNWDETKYQGYLQKFGLNENLKINQLSAGMKVKFALTLALSHNAKLLILDEPTSGLDPVSRDEFCDIILELSEQKITVLFSTHITSDLLKIADDVIYIDQGVICLSGTVDDILQKYYLVTIKQEKEAKNLPVIGLKPIKNGYQGLILRTNKLPNLTISKPTLDDIMIHIRGKYENTN